MPRQRGLRNRAEAERLRRQHEVADIGAAIDCAVDAERLVGVNDRDMRRAEEIVVLQRLLRIGHLVAPGDAERVVELKTALAAALEIDAEIFARRREIMVVFGAGRRLRHRSPCESVSLASPLAISTCQGWLLHHDAVRCATVRMCSMVARGTSCGRNARTE